MKRVARWIGIVLGGVFGLIVVAVLAVVSLVSYRMGQRYDVTPKAVAVSSEEALIARGEHLVRAIAGCDGCHGPDLGGMALLEDPAIMTLYGPNLTAGEGGVAGRFSDEDWDRTIRHGVGLDGKPLRLMPSQNYRWMTDEDLGAVVAYLKSVEPVDGEVPKVRLGPMGYLLALTEPGFLPARTFDHAAQVPLQVEPSVSVEYGGYLVWLGTCRDCHGQDLNGRQLPLPDEPPARNLTPAGRLSGWTAQDFIVMVRTGVTPGGDTLREPMAGVLSILRRQTDDELTAMYLYLQSLPPKPFDEP